MDLYTGLNQIARLSKSQISGFEQIGVRSAQDLLLYFPRRHLDFSVQVKINQLQANDTVTITGKIITIQKRFTFTSRSSLTEAIVGDGTGNIKVVWFNQPYIASLYKPGDGIALAGKVTRYKFLQLNNPIHEKFSENQIHTGRLVPIYKLPDNLYSRTIRGMIQKVLPLRNTIRDPIPKAIQTDFGLLSLAETIAEMHFPTNYTKLNQAKERLAFEEALVQQLAVAMHKQEILNKPAISIKPKIRFIQQVLKKLSFTLTIGQKQALWRILQDLEVKHPMNRLLEGDVGSGKTIVAFLSMLEVAASGKQSILLAPTEVLASQHYDNLLTLVKRINKPNILPALVTRSYKKILEQSVKTAEVNQKLLSGKIKIAIGTHALLYKPEQFKYPALIVVDEQHRFGVQQRGIFFKTPENTSVPHLLSMSATPIPRTLALTVYGDLEISRLTELPAHRKPISTSLIPEARRNEAYKFIKEQTIKGRQAFIITPLVEDSEKLQVKAVKSEFERLQKDVFPELKLGLLYGQMSAVEKEEVMNEFNKNFVQILVSTSVVEVGVDVPNATIMVIESAERFGLAQLHQLRGRVGRGEHQSYCFLFSSANTQTDTTRLQKFASIQDGFKLAEIDLETRGFGSLFGTNQSGFNFKFPEYMTLKTLKTAKVAAEKILLSADYKQQCQNLISQAIRLSEQLHLE